MVWSTRDRGGGPPQKFELLIDGVVLKFRAKGGYERSGIIPISNNAGSPPSLIKFEVNNPTLDANRHQFEIIQNKANALNLSSSAHVCPQPQSAGGIG